MKHWSLAHFHPAGLTLFAARGASGYRWRLLPYFVPMQLLGVLFSAIAFFIIRREFVYYSESEGRLLYLERELGLTARSGKIWTSGVRAACANLIARGATYQKREQHRRNVIAPRGGAEFDAAFAFCRGS